MHHRNKETNLLEANLPVVHQGGGSIPEGVSIFRRDFPALPNHLHCPPFPDGTFEEQRTSQSDLLMNY